MQLFFSVLLAVAGFAHATKGLRLRPPPVVDLSDANEPETKINPYLPRMPMPVIGGRMPVAAPADDVVPGIEAQALFPPGYGPEAAYWPKWEYPANPFPQTYDLNDERLPRRGLPTMDCATSPIGWKDAHGRSCQDYSDNWWCTADGKMGPGWPEHWGSLQDQRGFLGGDASSACCICGGGMRTMITGENALTKLDDRQLFAGADALPNTGMVPVKQYAVAPEDVIPESFAKYFRESYRAHTNPGLMGLSARFFSSPPVDSSVKVKASCIDRALEFGGSGAGSNGRQLQWPAIWGRAANTAGFFWGKWTGTLMLFTPGRYVFDLDVGFNTRSSLSIDGQALSSPGMCRVTPTRAACEAKGCVWIPDKAECLPGKKPAALLLQMRAPAPAEAYSPASSPGMSPGSAPSGPAAPFAAPAASPAASPMSAAPAESPPQPPPDQKTQPIQDTGSVAFSPASDGFPTIPPAEETIEAEEEVVPELAAAPAPSTGSSPMTGPIFSPAEMPENIVLSVPPAPLPVLAPAPQPAPSYEVDENAGTLELKDGPHCVEVTVMVTPSARSLALRYEGPDTSGKMTTIPGQVLFCDPVLSACEDPGPNACANLR